MNQLLLNELNSGMIADIVVIAIIAIFAISNVAKGFFKQVFKILSAIAAVVLAYYFCDELLAFLNEQFNVSEIFSRKILDLFGENAALIKEVTAENVAVAIAEMNLPEFIQEFAIQTLSSIASDAYANIGDFISHVAAQYILSAAAYIVLYLAARLILLLVAKLLELLIKLPVIRGFDKLLGFFWGLAKALFLIFIFIYVIDVLPIEGLAPIKSSISDSLLGAFLQRNNLFVSLIEWVVAKLPF